MFIHYKRTAVGEKLKTCSERSRLISSCYKEVFIRQPPFQDEHIWVVPAAVLCKFDCNNFFSKHT